MSLLVFLLEPTTFFAGVVFALSILWWLSTRRPEGLPPSPGLALPFIGHLHLLDKDPRVSFARWRQKYGDVFSLYMGANLVIVLNGYDVIKEALVKNGDAFSDRPRMFITEQISKNKGVLATSGSLWKEQRKVSLEIMREMGMGKNVLAEKIQQEVNEYVMVIMSLQGKAFNPRELTHVSVSNNICSIVFGQRFEYNDPLFTKYLAILGENFKILSGTALLNFFPFLQYVPGDPFKMKRVLSNVASVEKTLTRPQLEKHRNEYVEGDAPDFIHAYLREIRKHETCGQPTTIDEENLFQVIGDLFVAGSETTATAIRWALIFFLHNPEVQEKCFQEIKNVVGTERAPNMNDKPEMVYNEATIMEVLRRANMTPLGIQHSIAYDVTFKGYTLPKGAIVFPILETVLHDTEIWGDPLSFRPERFIGPEGKLIRPEEFIPFSIGRRVCLGEGLARVELFLYLTTMIQRFRFVSPEGEALPSLQGTIGLTYFPQQFQICAVPRE